MTPVAIDHLEPAFELTFRGRWLLHGGTPRDACCEKKEKKGKTPFQEYLERRKQKRKERKAKLAEMKKERKMNIQVCLNITILLRIIESCY